MALTDSTFTRIYESLFRAGRLIGTFMRPATSIPELNSGVHEGVAFSITSYNTALANAGTLVMFGMTGVKEVHFLGVDFTTNAGGWLIELYEAPTITANGTLQTPINLNFESTNTNGMTLYSGGTVSANGTLKLSKHLHSVGTGSANRVDTSGSLSSGMILKKNTSYMFRITNNSGATNPYEVTLEWVEK